MVAQSTTKFSTHDGSPSRVIKIDEFTGSLPTRPLYIYLPPGYDDEIEGEAGSPLPRALYARWAERLRAVC